MILVQDIIYENLEGLHELLDAIDADFTGTNGEEYYIAENTSGLDHALEVCRERNYNLQNSLSYIVESCKRYSGGYYAGFEYIIEQIYDNACMVTISVVKR